MKNVLILHGTDCNSQKHWLPWLKEECEKRGYKVWVPSLPRADKPNIERYNDFIFPKWKFNKDTIIVGHSSGSVAILGVLEQLPKSVVINKAILVGGFTDDMDYEPVKEMFVKPFNWKKIKTKARKFIFFHSDNDPYVPLRYGEKFRDLLSGELIVMKGQAHFSTTTYPGDRYFKFPELLEKILE
jgi:hypothetical protein